MSINTEIIDNFEGLCSLTNQWNSIADRFQTPLLRHEWFCASAEAFCPPGKLSIIVVRSNSEITAIAPLVLNPIFGVYRLELLGTAVLSEPSGLLYNDDESLHKLINIILSLRKPILFKGLSSESLELKYLKNTRRYRWRYSQIKSFASPWIPISMNWETFFSQTSSRWRSSIRRAQRKANEFGKVEFEIVTPNSETVERFLQEVFQVEMSGWKSRIGTALQTYSALGNFFTSYSQAAAKLGILRIAFLRIEGKAAAVQLLIEYANRMWVLKVGYDETYARCSPGILLMNDVIRHSFEKPLEAIELLGTNEPWLNIWPNQLHQFENYRLYPFAPRAIVSHGLELSIYATHRLQTIIAKRRKPSLRSTSSLSDND